MFKVYLQFVDLLKIFCIYFTHLECQPCPSQAEDEEPLLEGEKFEIDTNGCCPIRRRVCYSQDCLVQEDCSENFIKIKDVETINSCCPKFKCGKIGPD